MIAPLPTSEASPNQGDEGFVLLLVKMYLPLVNSSNLTTKNIKITNNDVRINEQVKKCTIKLKSLRKFTPTVTNHRYLRTKALTVSSKTRDGCLDRL